VSVTFRFDGLKELLAQFRSLSEDMTVAATPDVEASAREALDAIHSGYPSRTGDLRDHLTLTVTREADRVRATITNTSDHAVMFENGTQARHTAIGANRGSMPANPLFTATVMRARRELLSDPIPDVLREFGLKPEFRG
jgi:Bacteriophage HK97-gp10, putative tail-component